MIEGSLHDIKELEKLITTDATLLKDTSKSSKAHVKVYRAKGNPSWKTIRFFFDERGDKATVKIKDYYPVVCGICTFTLIHAGTLIQSTVMSWF